MERKPKTWVLGDVHGCHKALKQVFERSGFDYDNDTLIFLGDVADGWNHVYECVDEFLNIRYFIGIRGNHDAAFIEYINTGVHPWRWQQGGVGTATSYLRRIGKEDLIVRRDGGEDGYMVGLNPDDVPSLHQKFFRDLHTYYIDDKNRLFVHGGFNRHFHIKDQMAYILEWDRDMWSCAQCCHDGKLKTKDNFEKIFIGHTHVDGRKNPLCLPLEHGGVVNLDTGAGFSGKLTLMNVDQPNEYYQSDMVRELYPDEAGRK